MCYIKTVESSDFKNELRKCGIYELRNFARFLGLANITSKNRCELIELILQIETSTLWCFKKFQEEQMKSQFYPK